MPSLRLSFAHVALPLFLMAELSALEPPKPPLSYPQLTFRAAPRALPAGAVTEDWPRFLGARDNATSKETKLLEKWPEGGPKVVWEMAVGDGYSSPIVVGDRLVYFHRVDGKETLDCLDPETGKRYWRFDYAVDYKDRYGFSPGPRSSPVVHDGRIYLVGVTAMFHCLDLMSGKVIWKRDLKKEYAIPQGFFGYAPNPVAWKDRIIINIGGKEDGEKGTCVAALDAKSGKTLWQVKDTWGASYASPTVTTLQGKDVALVVAAGESRPAHGGLLTIDPNTGKVFDRFPWRADIYESVLASSPFRMNDKHVYFAECYEKGGVVLEFDANLKSKVLWEERWFGMHWMIPLLIDGHLYGFAGRNIPDTEFKCTNVATGKIIWNDEMRFKEGKRTHGFFRATLLQADGRVFCLGEDGLLAELELTPRGSRTIQRVRLFSARDTWILPTLSKGLLYVSQNNADFLSNEPSRIICYDFRGE